MKKIKYFSVIFAFIAVLFITKNVNAQRISYKTLQCDEYWTPSNGCNKSSDNVNVYTDAIVVDFSENGNVELVSVSPEANESDIDICGSSQPELKSYTENRYEMECGSQFAHYDISYLEKYYQESKTIPENIIILAGSDASGSMLYLGVSELELINLVGKYYTIYYYSINDTLATAYSCVDLVFYKNALEDKIKQYGAESEVAVSYASKIENICQDYLGYNVERKNACYALCKDLDSAIAEMGVDIFNETNSCGLGERMVAWIIRILKILRFIVPSLVIVLTTYEYITAFMAAEDDAIKKVGARLGKRLFIMILFFVLPSLIQFILNVFNVDGLDSSNPYCIK